jgi:hypothetical protein
MNTRWILLAAVLTITGAACGTRDPNDSISFADCASEGGEAYTDPGDGSLEGCPDGMTQIGVLEGAIEGGFCCT